ncbi:hypothetical protein M011DRAFT_350017 [Sporormia fimetaria CBS 119925]|uniref:Uncharacterized protein n=1 Tax=Sporormia fimetaria CBS 119925 TaxID=1340428 RepID=A0A6A6VFH1_9PLEO|nr:hypothetical protein M011DRAFT_350017 [Sporormia fimetaria CBS 119925]
MQMKSKLSGSPSKWRASFITGVHCQTRRSMLLCSSITRNYYVTEDCLVFCLRLPHSWHIRRRRQSEGCCPLCRASLTPRNPHLLCKLITLSPVRYFDRIKKNSRYVSTPQAQRLAAVMGWVYGRSRLASSIPGVMVSIHLFMLWSFVEAICQVYRGWSDCHRDCLESHRGLLGRSSRLDVRIS